MSEYFKYNIGLTRLIRKTVVFIFGGHLRGHGRFHCRFPFTLVRFDHRRTVNKLSGIVLVAVAVHALSLSLAKAETLYDAFNAAYSANPTLGAQRVAVRISQKDRAITATGFAPSVAASGDYGYEDIKGQAPGNPTTDNKTYPRGYGVSLQQNVFNGFSTLHGLERDSASVDAARARLCDVEQQILIEVATAYSDVLRDKAILDLHRADHKLLETRGKETHVQYNIGNLTQTDVDQSAASVARSQADLAIAESNLESSVASFRSVVGRDPGRLEAAAVPERLIPADIVRAVAIAQAEHPAILAARNAVRAAELNVAVEAGGFAPSVDLNASAQRRYDPDYYPAKTDLTSLTVGGRITIPLYDRGLTFASVSRAKEVSSQRRLELDQQLLRTRADVVQNWGVFNASKLVIVSATAQIAASQRALYGVQLEATAGQRTTLDTLTAQRALLEARVNREIAQHDRIIAGYRLLASVGRLSLQNLTVDSTRGRALPDLKPRGLDVALQVRGEGLRASNLVALSVTSPALPPSKHQGPLTSQGLGLRLSSH